MVISRTMSYAAIIAAVVFFNGACASEVVKNGLQKAGGHAGTILGIAVATGAPEDCDAAKAAIETTGVLLDQVLTPTMKDDKMALQPRVLVVNFAANFVARKSIKCLNANGIKMPTPEVGGFAGSHIVSPLNTALRTAAPQAFAGLVVMGARHARLV